MAIHEEQPALHRPARLGRAAHHLHRARAAGRPEHRRHQAGHPGDRPADPGPAVHHQRREGQGGHPHRRLPRPCRLRPDDESHVQSPTPGPRTLSTRSKARKRALDILFEADLRGTDPLETLAARTDRRGPAGARLHRHPRARGGHPPRPRWTGGSPPAWPRGGPSSGCRGWTAPPPGSRSTRSTTPTSRPAVVVSGGGRTWSSELSTDDSPSFVHGVLGGLVGTRQA